MIFWIVAVMLLEFGLGYFLGTRQERKKCQYIIEQQQRIIRKHFADVIERKIDDDSFYNE